MEIIEKINKILDFTDGFYIECGAHDGKTQSNTLLLETEKNWSGLLIEPSPKAFEQLVENRSKKNIFYNVALVSHNYIEETVLGDFDGTLMASVNGSRLGFKNLISVSAKTLTSIIQENNIKKIDFFSLDVEGYELEVLKGLDFSIVSPTYILIEVYNFDKEVLFNFMLENNYDLVCNLSDFKNSDNLIWDGTHDDYLFKLRDLNLQYN
jgi:FkbM family methyltransferase